MPGNILSDDMNFPSFTGKESVPERLGTIENYLRMLLSSLRYTLSNLESGNMNETALSELSDAIAGKAVKLTVSGLTISAENGEESSTIKITSDGVEIASADISFSGMVTFTGLAGGTTIIDGGCIQTGEISADRVRGGTLEGVEVKSGDGVAWVDITSGATVFGSIGDASGKIYCDSLSGRFVIEGLGGAMKLAAPGNMSVDADGTVYLATDDTRGGQAVIGRAGGRVDLNGDVYVNGVPL